MSTPKELHELADLVARLGADPLLVQGAGGNASIKLGNALWIKASGTKMKDALAREIFVPVNREELLRNFGAGTLDFQSGR